MTVAEGNNFDEPLPIFHLRALIFPPALAPHLLMAGVHKKIRIFPFQPPALESCHLAQDALGQSTDKTLVQMLDAHLAA